MYAACTDFFKQKTAYEISACLVGSEMCIRDSLSTPCIKYMQEKGKLKSHNKTKQHPMNTKQIRY